MCVDIDAWNLRLLFPSHPFKLRMFVKSPAQFWADSRCSPKMTFFLALPENLWAALAVLRWVFFQPADGSIVPHNKQRQGLDYLLCRSPLQITKHIHPPEPPSNSPRSLLAR